MTEFHKYIVDFDLVTFLGFNKQFSSKFKQFTNFITQLIKVNCILFLFLVAVRDLLTIKRLINKEFEEYL